MRCPSTPKRAPNWAIGNLTVLHRTRDRTKARPQSHEVLRLARQPPYWPGEWFSARCAAAAAATDSGFTLTHWSSYSRAAQTPGPEPCITLADGMVLKGRDGGRGSARLMPPRLARWLPGRGLRMQPQVGEGLLDRRSLQDGGDDHEVPGAAVRAVLHIDVKAKLQRRLTCTQVVS